LVAFSGVLIKNNRAIVVSSPIGPGVLAGYLAPWTKKNYKKQLGCSYYYWISNANTAWNYWQWKWNMLVTTKVDKHKKNCVYVGWIKTFGGPEVSTKKNNYFKWKKKKRIRGRHYWSYKRNQKKRLANVENVLSQWADVNVDLIYIY
jgi:hypothetical protein